MKPRVKLGIANGLMLAGFAPLALAVWWCFAVAAYAQTHEGQMGGSDAFMMILFLLAGYVIALAVSGGGLLWSTAVGRRHPDARTVWTRIVQALAGIALALPLLWYAGVALGLIR